MAALRNIPRSLSAAIFAFDPGDPAALHGRLFTITSTKQSQGRPGQRHLRGAELERFTQKVVQFLDKNPLIGSRGIAKHFGISRAYVFRLLKRAGRKIPGIKGRKMPLRHRQAIRRALNRPEVRQQRSQAGKEAWADSELRAAQSTGMKEQWKDPEYRELRHTAMLEAQTPKERKRKSKRSKQNWDRLTPGQRENWVKNLTAGNRARAARGNRPADWWEKPLLWRIVGDVLLSRDGYMSNEELAKRLDDSPVLKCPTKYGENWEAAVRETGAAVKFISKVRAWLDRPGKIPGSKNGVTPPRAKNAGPSSLF